MDSVTWFGKVKRVKALRLSECSKEPEPDKRSLKDESCDDSERFFSAVVAFFVEVVDGFQPAWRFGEQVAESCQVVGQNGAEGACKKSPARGGVKKGR